MEHVPMSLIITGASGELGRRTAELLLETGGVSPADVVLVTRSTAKLADLAARGAQVRHGDFDDPATLPGAFAGATRVLIISTTELGTRVTGHLAAVAAAKEAGARLIAYTSIPNPDPARNPAPVVPDHAKTEEAIVASGVPYTFLRNSLYSELWRAMMEAPGALASGELVYNTGDGAIANVSREDAAAAAAAVLAGGDEHAGKAYDLTGPELLTGPQLADLYAWAGARAVKATPIDDAAMVAFMVRQGLPEDAAEIWAAMGKAIREGALNQVTEDVERLTGRKPATVRQVLEAAGVGVSRS
jgi:NAD(P)H dehydrogenase (quinone)